VGALRTSSNRGATGPPGVANCDPGGGDPWVACSVRSNQLPAPRGAQVMPFPTVECPGPRRPVGLPWVSTGRLVNPRVTPVTGRRPGGFSASEKGIDGPRSSSSPGPKRMASIYRRRRSSPVRKRRPSPAATQVSSGLRRGRNPARRARRWHWEGPKRLLSWTSGAVRASSSTIAQHGVEVAPRRFANRVDQRSAMLALSWH